MKHSILFAILVLMTARICSFEDSVLPSQINRYNDVEVVISENHNDAAFFEKRLDTSIKAWKERGYKAIWLTLPVQNIALLSSVLKFFTFHHSTHNKVVLTRWLDDTIPNILPLYSMHIASVASLVVDENNNVLVIKDKWGGDKAYKLPGGNIELGEQIWECAMREVKEETGIDTVYEGLIAFRHGSSFAVGFGEQCNPIDYASKLFFCCLLRPISKEIVIQESEILEGKWMPYEEYKNSAQGVFVDFLKIYEEGKKPFIKSHYNEQKKMTFYTASAF